MNPSCNLTILKIRCARLVKKTVNMPRYSITPDSSPNQNMANPRRYNDTNLYFFCPIIVSPQDGHGAVSKRQGRLGLCGAATCKVHVIVRGLHWRHLCVRFRTIKTHSRTAIRNVGSCFPERSQRMDLSVNAHSPLSSRWEEEKDVLEFLHPHRVQLVEVHLANLHPRPWYL